MTDTEKKRMQLANEILNLVNFASEIPYTDIQGVAEAIATKYIEEDRDES